MSEPLVVIVAILGVVFTGRSVLTLIDRICGTLGTPRPQAEIWGISILLGISFTAASGFVWSDCGGPLNTSLAWRQTVIGSLLGIFATVRSLGRKQPAFVEPIAPSSPFLTRFFRFALGLVIAGAFGLSLIPPELEFEERAPRKERVEIDRKAKVLFQTGSIDSPELVPDGGYPVHFREPLMLPLAERHVAALLGRLSDTAPAIWSPLSLAGLALSFAGVLTRRTATAWGWILATGLAVMPILWSSETGILARVADIPTTSFHGVAVLYVWDALQRAPGRDRICGLLIASGMASSCVFTKSEGLSYLIVDVLAWGIATLGSRGVTTSDDKNTGRSTSWGRELFGLAIFVLFTAFLLAPWMIYRHALPTGPVAPRVSQPPEFLRDLFHLIIQDWWKTGLPWGLMLLALLSSPRRSWAVPQRFLLLTLVGTLVIAELVLAPAGLKGYLGGSSQPFLMHLTPLTILFVAAAWGPTGSPVETTASIPGINANSTTRTP